MAMTGRRNWRTPVVSFCSPGQASVSVVQYDHHRPSELVIIVLGGDVCRYSVFGVTDVTADPCDLLLAEPDEISADGAVHLIIDCQSLQQGLELGIIRQIGIDNL